MAKRSRGTHQAGAGSVGGLRVFTVGHSNHPLDRFLDLLKGHEIEAVADIRRFPGSRKHPHFDRERLEEALREAGIEYHWIEELGGRREKPADGRASPNEGLRNQSFRNYADYMLTSGFQQGLKQLVMIARRRRTAMMCAEGLYWQCHRRLVSDYLLAGGATVEHLLPNGRVKPHPLTEGAQPDADRVLYPPPKSLFEQD